MNGDGKMQTGWLLYNNTWHYLSESGVMVTGWITLGDKAYYLGGDGGMLTDGRTSTDRSTTCIRMDIRRSMK